MKCRQGLLCKLRSSKVAAAVIYPFLYFYPSAFLIFDMDSKHLPH